VNPDDLIPELPKLSDLQPFPTTEALVWLKVYCVCVHVTACVRVLAQVYEGHSGKVQSVCVDSAGQWLASAASDGSIKVWEVSTGRCVRTVTLHANPVALSFCPSATRTLLSIAV
jgi:ribosome biogenesis protein ERB1